MSPTPLAAYDVSAEGVAAPIGTLSPKDGWRWEHFDIATPGLGDWLQGEVGPLVARAVMADETRPRVDVQKDGLIVTLRGVNKNAGADPEDMVSLRMWVTGDRIISIQRLRLMALDGLCEDAEDGQAPASSAAFLAALTDVVTQHIDTVALEFEDMVDDLEERSITKGATSSIAFLTLRQAIIKLRRFVVPQRDALEYLGAADKHLIPDLDASHIRETANRTARTVETLDAMRDRLVAIQDHLDAQTAMQLGRNSYIFSVMAAIFLPLGFLTGLFGVNVAGMPGTGMIYAFWILTGICIMIGGALFAYFRWKGWL